MIIFKINFNKKLGKNNSGHIVTRHKEKGYKSLYIPIDLNYFNYTDIFSNTLLYLTNTKSNLIYRNTKIISSLCLSGKLKGEFRYILKPYSKEYNDFIQFSNITNKIFGNISYLKNFNIGNKLYNIEFKPFCKSKVCISYKNFSILINFLNNNIILKLPSNKLKYFNNLCYSCYGYSDGFKIINKMAGYSRNTGNRPKVRGTAMNAVDHPHGGGTGKSPIGRKTIYTFKGKKYKGIKTSKN